MIIQKCIRRFLAVAKVQRLYERYVSVQKVKNPYYQYKSPLFAKNKSTGRNGRMINLINDAAKTIQRVARGRMVFLSLILIIKTNIKL